MGNEVLKELIREVEKLEGISFEKFNELEIIYEVTADFILSLYSEIQKIKATAGRNHLTPEIILLVMEEKLINAMFDSEYYTSLMVTFDFDDERLEETRKSQQLAINKVERYNMLLGTSEGNLNLNNPKK